MNYNNDLPGGKQVTRGDKKTKKTVISLLVISHKLIDSPIKGPQGHIHIQSRTHRGHIHTQYEHLLFTIVL